MIHTEVFFPEFLFIPFTVEIELHIGHKDFCSTINEEIAAVDDNVGNVSEFVYQFFFISGITAVK